MPSWGGSVSAKSRSIAFVPLIPSSTVTASHRSQAAGSRMIRMLTLIPTIGQTIPT